MSGDIIMKGTSIFERNTGLVGGIFKVLILLFVTFGRVPFSFSYFLWPTKIVIIIVVIVVIVIIIIIILRWCPKCNISFIIGDFN